MFRFPAGTTPAAIFPVIDPVLVAMLDCMSASDSVIGARFSQAGSDFSLPVDYGPYPGTGTTINSQGDPESRYIDAVGRGTTTGAKVRWTLFTPSAAVQVPATNRIQPGDSITVDAFITALGGVTSGAASGPQVVTVQGDVPIVYLYANSGWNYHWLRQQRS